MNWQAVGEDFKKSPSAVKSDLTQLLLSESREAASEIAQDIVDSCYRDASSAEWPLRMFVVRTLYQTHLHGVLAKLCVSRSFVEWVSAVLVSDAAHCNIATRGTAMSVASYLLRYSSKSLLVEELAMLTDGICTCLLQQSTILLSQTTATEVDSSQNEAAEPAEEAPINSATEQQTATMIILHQCTEFLVSIRDTAGDWLRGFTKLVPVVAKLVIHCGTTGGIAQVQVDAAKIFGMVMEIYLATIPSQKSTTLTAAITITKELIYDVVAALDIIIQGVVSCKILHDSFTNAFRAGIEFCAVQYDTSLCDLLAIQSHFSELITDEINRNALDQMISLKRVEILQALLGCALSPRTHGNSSNDGLVELVETAINTIVSLQSRMKHQLVAIKSALVDESTEDPLSSLNEKEYKAACSDVRKASVVAVEQLLRSCPAWIRANKEKYWTLCIKSLSTPRLFTVGYLAHDSADIGFCSSVTSYMHTALKSIDKYSSSVAVDILNAIRDIYLPCTNPGYPTYHIVSSPSCLIPRLLWEAYHKPPKIPKSSSAQKESTGGAVSDERPEGSVEDIRDVMDWRMAVLSVLKDTLATLTSLEMWPVLTKTAFLSSFTESFLGTLCEDIQLCHRLLGNNPGPKGVGSAGSGLKALKASGLQRLGSVDPEEGSAWLSTATACLDAFFEVCIRYRNVTTISADDSTIDFSRQVLMTLSGMLRFLEAILNREAVFVGDLEQLCNEAMLIAKGALYLWLQLPQGGTATAAVETEYTTQFAAFRALVMMSCLRGRLENSSVDGANTSIGELSDEAYELRKTLYLSGREAAMYLLSGMLQRIKSPEASATVLMVVSARLPADGLAAAAFIESLKDTEGAKTVVKELTDLFASTFL